MRGARIERFAQFFAGADFDLDWQVAGARALDRVADPSSRGDVIVLDQNGIVQTHPVVSNAAGRGRAFFQNAETGSSLAGVEYAAVCARDSIGELARQGS